MIAPSTIQRLLKEQHNACWNCGRPLTKYEVHHAIYTRDKKFAKWLDMPHNLQLLCPACHAKHGYLSSWYGRCSAWTDKINQGYDMQGWHDSIPMLVKDNFLYFEKPKGADAMLMWDVGEKYGK